MKKLQELITDFGKDYCNLLNEYSKEFGKLKGGIIKCELADLTNYEVYDSILEAADNDFGLTDRIISGIYDGEEYVVIGDQFYTFYDDFFRLPGMYCIIRQKAELPAEEKQKLLAILGPKCGECQY